MPTNRAVERRIDRVLSRQHGVIATRQARAAGLTRGQIRQRVTSGRWRRLARGVFQLVGTPSTFRQRAMAACLALGDRAVVSHASAGHLLAPNSVAIPDAVELTLPMGCSGDNVTAPSVVVHRSRNLDARDVVILSAIPVTRPARVLVDMAAERAQHDLDDLVDEMLWRYPTLRPPTVLDTLSRAGPVRGGHRLRSALGPWLSGPQPESVPEMSLLRRLTEAGLPAPERQYEIRNPITGAFVARADLAYPGRRLAIEYDGGLAHGPRQRGRDERRRNEVIRAGWLTITARADDVRRATCGPFVELVRLKLDRPAN